MCQDLWGIPCDNTTRQKNTEPKAPSETVIKILNCLSLSVRDKNLGISCQAAEAKTYQAPSSQNNQVTD